MAVFSFVFFFSHGFFSDFKISRNRENGKIKFLIQALKKIGLHWELKSYFSIRSNFPKHLIEPFNAISEILEPKQGVNTLVKTKRGKGYVNTFQF